MKIVRHGPLLICHSFSPCEPGEEMEEGEFPVEISFEKNLEFTNLRIADSSPQVPLRLPLQHDRSSSLFFLNFFLLIK